MSCPSTVFGTPGWFESCLVRRVVGAGGPPLRHKLIMNSKSLSGGIPGNSLGNTSGYSLTTGRSSSFTSLKQVKLGSPLKEVLGLNSTCIPCSLVSRGGHWAVPCRPGPGPPCFGPVVPCRLGPVTPPCRAVPAHLAYGQAQARPKARRAGVVPCQPKPSPK